MNTLAETLDTLSPEKAVFTVRAGITICVFLALLVGCDGLDNSPSPQAFYILVSDCAFDKLTDRCSLAPLERLDLTVSVSAQKVAWKRTRLDGTVSEYATGKQCAVISRDDFKCTEISKSSGSVTLANILSDWPEVFGRPYKVDDHLYAWALWLLSPYSSTTIGTFQFLATGFASGIAVIVVALLGLYTWSKFADWSEQPSKLPVLSQGDTAEDRRRKNLGYD